MSIIARIANRNGGLLAAALLGLAPAPGSAQAQTAPLKEITINVGFGAGGVYHTMSMLLSRHLGKFMPGQPPVVVKTMPGAGSILAANYLYNVAPKDGSALGSIGGGTILEPLFRNAEAKYDPAKFNWIGTTSSETYTCVGWRASPIEKITDATQREMVAGSTGRGSRTYTYASALNDLLGTRIKIVTGYRGMTDIHLAMERGELDSVCGWGYSSIFSQKPDWIRDNKIRILLQFGYAKNPDIPDVPLVLDVLQNDRDRAAMRLMVLDALIAWPLVAPPGVPAERVAELRKAYDTALKEPALLAEAKQLQLVIAPVSGEEIAKAVAETMATPRDVVDHARKLSGLD
ncbi:MAG: tripartite tricarboxylate transporter family receptor [Hyphomicrobiales bacterium]|nr:tripartite tricarboxylate transporter family receptor [Hyphomicrobiales bacterium]